MGSSQIFLFTGSDYHFTMNGSSDFLSPNGQGFYFQSKITHNFWMQFTKYNNFLSSFDLILYPSQGNLTTHIAISCVFLVGNELVTIFCRIRANKGAARIAPRGFKIRRRRSHKQNFGASHINQLKCDSWASSCLTVRRASAAKAKFAQEGIFFALQLFAW